MITHILDSDTLTLLSRKVQVVVERVDARPPGSVGIASPNVQEQLSGRLSVLNAAKTPAEIAEASAKLNATVTFLARFPLLPMSEAAVEQLNELKRQKRNIGAMDLRIAAVALATGAAVVTRNRRDFGRVPGLRIEDWSV